MKYKKFHKISHPKILIFLLILVIVNLFLLCTFLAKPQSVVITLTEQGFKPNTITVDKNTQVIFKTDGNTSFWPASNLHPTHNLYPDFDSRKPIAKNTTWKFTFTKKGTWTFHDHLSPDMRGTITVGDRTAINLTDNCIKETTHRMKCYEKYITQVVASKNIEKVFATISHLYESDPTFAADCHDFTHRVGERAAELYIKGTNIPLSDKAAYCAYGFYHGFMSELFQQKYSFEKMTEFCNSVATSQSDALGDACYHGVGHGSYTDYRERHATIEPTFTKGALLLCERIAQTNVYRSRCASGVYMELANVLLSKNYISTIDVKNPLALCLMQPTIYKIDCYTQFNSIIHAAAQSDIAKGISFIEQIPEDIYAVEAIVTYMGAIVPLEATQTQKYVSLCRASQERIHLPCIKGMSLAYMLRGIPQKEYLKAINLCKDSELNFEEKDACYMQVLTHGKSTYSPTLLAHVCTNVDGPFKKYCL